MANQNSFLLKHAEEKKIILQLKCPKPIILLHPVEFLCQGDIKKEKTVRNKVICEPIFSKQDVFVGFATVPGFVSLTSTEGSPYLQEKHIFITNEKTNSNYFPPGSGHPVG